MIASAVASTPSSSASPAVAADSTAYPALRSLSCSARRICGSSSTTRMRAPLTRALPPVARQPVTP